MASNNQLPRWFQNAKWIIKLRWFAIACTFLITIISQYLFNISLPFNKIYILIVLLFFTNLVYLLTIYINTKNNKILHFRQIRLFLNLQVSVDLSFLTGLLHFSGGIENPVIVFYIFHIILSSILLPRIDSFIQATYTQILFICMVVLEYKNVLPHYALNEHLSDLLESDIRYLSFALFVFSTTSYMVVFLTSYVTRQLRKNELKLVKLNNKLNEKDKVKNEYVLRLTHDIKGYVTSIKSSLDVLNMGIYGEINERYKPFLESTNKILNQLSVFIRDLLRLTRSKLDGDQIKEDVVIHQLIHNVIDELKIQISEKKINITTKIEPDLKKLYAFPLSVKEMMINVIGNAIKYSSANGDVIIEAKKYNSKNALFTITDKGIGIPDNEIPQLFNEFYRASNASKEYEGSGLGLAIVKQIVYNHGGKVWIKSLPLKGTSVYITLPFSPI